MFERLEENLLSWMVEGYAFPYRIHILPTNRCNLSCESCWRWKYEDGKLPSKFEEVPNSRLINLVEESAEIGVEEWELSGGGEPFYRKEVVLKMMEEIKKYNMRGKVTTNGTLFTPEIIKFLVETGWDQIMISLDGPNADINDKLRPPSGTFEKIIFTLEQFQKLKNTLSSNKPTIAIVCVLSKVNSGHIISMAELAAKYGIKSLYFEEVKNFSSKCESLLLKGDDYNKIQKQVNSVLKIADKNGFNTNLDKFLIKSRMRKKKKVRSKNNSFRDNFLNLKCYEPWYRIVINAKGETAPCCVVPTSNKYNVKNMSLSDVWLGKHFEDFRKRIIAQNLFPQCKQCSVCLLGHADLLHQKLSKEWKKMREKDKSFKKLMLDSERLKTKERESLKYFYQKIRERYNKINYLKSEVSKKDVEIDGLKEKISRLDEKLISMQENLRVSTNGYKAKQKELRDVYNSTGFKYLLKPLWTIIGLPKRFIKKLFRI